MRAALRIAAIFALAAVASLAPAAENFGRLFFTPVQRAALDRGQEVGSPRKGSVPTQPRGPLDLTLNGVMTRSDGESAVWVNNRLLDEAPPGGVSAAVSPTDPAAARLKIGGRRDSVKLRVGQRLKRTSGTVSEPYESTPTGRNVTPGSAVTAAQPSDNTVPASGRSDQSLQD